MSPSCTGGTRQGASLRFAFVVLLGALALAPACAPGPRLIGGLDSPIAVASAVIDALNRRDVKALERLVVSEEEFRDLVWPRQPAARPGRNVPWEYAWKDLAAKSRMQLRGRLAEWTPDGGVAVVDVSFAGDTTDYETYRVFRKSAVTLRDGAGRLVRTRIFGSVIEQGGRYKVFSYVVD